jgi:NodT family efflux transporter outer membrane factor (OMF) lipoprotein
MTTMTMKNRQLNHLAKISFASVLILVLVSCKSLRITSKEAVTTTPTNFNNSSDTSSAASIKWNAFFTDPNLVALIDSALHNNKELNITLQEINIAQNEVRARKGEYLPNLGVGVASGIEKVGEYTTRGANEKNDEIVEGKKNPEAIPDFMVGAFASWEIDIWKKLRNAKKSAYFRYLGSVDGKNYVMTNLIAEIANSYYELLALDNQLQIVQKNIEIQSNALEIVKQQKQAAQTTELAVKKFEAEVAHTKSMQFDIKQQIVVTENKINFLIGRFPQPIVRSTDIFLQTPAPIISTGIPSQLLANRSDIRQAENELAASKLDVKVAKAKFYPSFTLRAGAGFQSFNLKYFIQTPQSLLFSLMGDLIAPLVNRNAIKAEYYSANSKQIQAAFKYEQAIINGYVEVANQLSNTANLNESLKLRTEQVNALNASISIASNLFKSAEADYMEVLMTQRDALEAKFELVETKMNQLKTSVNLYKALGGGWK